MTVVKFPGKCEKCGLRLPNCGCAEMVHDPLWEAVMKIDLSKGVTLDEFVVELKRMLNEE